MKQIKLGSRKSKLALWQAHHISDWLQKVNPGLEVEIVRFVTQGDRRTDVPLSQVGGKGLFVKEIEDALLKGEIDIAVHSLKDMPGILPPGLQLGCTPKREDPRDALLGKDGKKLKDLQAGAVVGTSSLRRVAQLKHVRPDLQIVALRGNVDTRLRRLESGDFDAIILAYAGLKRLSLNEHVTEILEYDVLLPAVGQGALAIESREGDAATLAVLAPLHDADTHACITAERSFLAQAEGSCQVPLAAHGQLSGDELILTALIASPAGNPIIRGMDRGPRSEAIAIGKRLADRLLSQGGLEILAACRA